MNETKDLKLLEAILFASSEPVLEEDLKDKIYNKIFNHFCLLTYSTPAVVFYIYHLSFLSLVCLTDSR